MKGISWMKKIAQIAAGGDMEDRVWSLYWLARWCVERCPEPGGIVVELGVRTGNSTRALLAACVDCGAKLYSFDTTDCRETVTKVNLAAGMPSPFEFPWEFRQQDSREVGRMWPHWPVDMIFVDTDHSVVTTTEEILHWNRHVRVGGAMVFHDYFLFEAPMDGVKIAVDQFARDWPKHWRLETHADWGRPDTGLAVLWRTA
jgi:predicted O-methyltransferase YrrM